MTSRAQLLTGFGVGLMHLLDPGRGARRGAGLRDAAMNATHTATDAAGTTRRDVTNRLRNSRRASDTLHTWRPRGRIPNSG